MLQKSLLYVNALIKTVQDQSEADYLVLQQSHNNCITNCEFMICGRQQNHYGAYRKGGSGIFDVLDLWKCSCDWEFFILISSEGITYGFV